MEKDTKAQNIRKKQKKKSWKKDTETREIESRKKKLRQNLEKNLKKKTSIHIHRSHKPE